MRAQILMAAFVISASVASALDLTGAHANSLSRDDVRQIERLVARHSELSRTIRTLEVIHRSRVRVEAGQSDGPRRWSGSSFFVVRRNGIWHIDTKTRRTALAERKISIQ